MYGLADRVTVFRDAQYIGTWNLHEVEQSFLIHHMDGRDITQLYPKKKTETGRELLRLENLSRTGFFRDVNISVKAGEIVGLTGLVGAGRTEVMESVFGIHQPDSGKIIFMGEEIPTRSHTPAGMMAKGFGYLPEEIGRASCRERV